MKKSKLSILVLLVLSCLTWPFNLTTAFAHVLETNNTVGAVMHITPDDNPLAGKESAIILSFKDKEGKFSQETCDCELQIRQNKKVLFSQPLFQSITNTQDTTATIFYTFPKKNTYTISVIGKPIPEESFVPFTLNYTIQVEQEKAKEITTKKTTPSNMYESFTNYFVLLFLFFVIIFVGLFLFRRYKK